MPSAKKTVAAVEAGRDPIIIAVAVRKGGAGKTTLAAQFAYFLHSKGHKVLVVDLDTQGHAAHIFLDGAADQGGASLLFTKRGERTHVYPSHTTDLFVIPPDVGVAGIDALPAGVELLFRANIRAVARAAGVDYVIIDTPPTDQMALLAPLVAADYAFSPFKPDDFGILGVGALVDRIGQIKASMNTQLHYLGMLVNQWSRTDSDQRELVDDLTAAYPEHVIPYRIGLRKPIGRIAKTRAPVWAQNSGASGVAARELRAAFGWMLEQMETR